MSHTPIRPIFIGGCERSGTTMLGALLGGAKGAVTTPESQFKNRLFKLANETGFLPDEGVAMEQLNHLLRFRIWQVPFAPEEIGAAKGGHPISLAAFLGRCVHRYAKANNQPHPTLWIDHSPCNLRYAQTLLRHFPDAKFIHLIRDGRGVMNSFFNLSWGPKEPQSAARLWLYKLAYGLAAECAYPDRVLRVRYEDLIEEPKKTLQSICAFANLPYREEMLTGSGFAVPEYTRHQHALVGGGVDKSAAGRWQGLEKEELALFEAHCGDTLRMLGYEPSGHASKVSGSKRWLLVLRRRLKNLQNSLLRHQKKRLYQP